MATSGTKRSGRFREAITDSRRSASTNTARRLLPQLEAAMGRQDYHLWRFQAGDRRYGSPGPEWPDGNLAAAKQMNLGALIERGIRQLIYTYDIGDNWRHTVVIEAVKFGEPDTKYPRFVAGKRRCPLEDVGGFPGFEPFLDAMSNAAHEEHQDLR
jgi:hypothetical protein